jgi:pimeloyl-ACP methyl ester carboxylesterase
VTDFVPHHARVTAEGAKPERWMLVLHGIFGSGGNFRSFARRLAVAAPTWGFVLVDLRMHGLSQGAPPPHGLAAAADDLVRLEEHLGLPVDAVMGHSFGGKVTLAYLARRARPLAQAFVLDASPSARPDGPRAGETGEILDLLASMPWPLPSRERFLELVTSAGHSRAIAEWLAMNVRPSSLVPQRAGTSDEGFVLRLDLSAIRALLADYFATDLWSVVEAPPVREALHVVVGGRSDALPEDERARLRAIAAREPRLRVHELPAAGHWVHVDDPEGLFAIVRGALAR